RLDDQGIRQVDHRCSSRLRDARRLQDRLAGAGRHLLGPVVVDPDQARPAGLAVVPDRALLTDEREAVGLQQADQLAELHRSAPIRQPDRVAWFAIPWSIVYPVPASRKGSSLRLGSSRWWLLRRLTNRESSGQPPWG